MPVSDPCVQSEVVNGGGMEVVHSPGELYLVTHCSDREMVQESDRRDQMDFLQG